MLVVLFATASITPAQTRLEFHLLPAVSTGPLDPAWSPDGNWIAFSMRGDIWKIPADGGEAVALTEGPAYHFEPAWSPDGSRLALTYETDGNLEIGVVEAAGGAVTRLTDNPDYDLEPTWGPSGDLVYFASRRGAGGLDIYRVPASGRGGAAGTPPDAEPFITDRGNQYYPAISPDGQSIAYLSPVDGGLGSGGIWVAPLDRPDQPRLARYEETSYRARPAWSADSRSIFYSSDAAGSNDIAVVAAAGDGATGTGNRVRLTEDPGDEFAVTTSPDGTRIAFVSNETGPTTLFTMEAAGGPRRAWRAVEMTTRTSRAPTGTFSGRTIDSAGQPMPARIMIRAADGRAYTEDGGFHRMMWVNKTHYAHTDGTFEIEVPAGPLSIEAMRGFEYVPRRAAVVIPAGGNADVRIQLARLEGTGDLIERGWYSSDMHTHDLHEGRFGLTQEMFFRQLEADDVRVTNALIHRDGTKLMGRWDDLTGEPYRLSTADRILYYTQEFRGSYGHVALLGLQRFIMPLIGGARGTPYEPDVLKLRHIDAAHEQGGIAGFVHPYNGPVGTPGEAAGADIPVHVALGRGDFFDVVSIASLEDESTAMYYRLLNCGFRIAATGGTDNFSDVWLDPSGGTARTYVHLPGDSPVLTLSAWLDAVRAGRTFGTSGPLLFLTVSPAGVDPTPREPGAQIDLGPDDPTRLEVQLEVASIVPLDTIEIVANGEVVQHWNVAPGGADTPSGSVAAAGAGEPRGEAATGYTASFAASLDLPDGGWITARAAGPPSKYVGDAFPFAQTSPVYVVRDGVPYTSPADARFLLETVEILWQRVERRDAFTDAADKRAYRDAIDRAREVYQAIIRRGG